MTDNLISITINIQGLKADSLTLSKSGWDFYAMSIACFDYYGRKYTLFTYEEPRTALAMGQFIISEELCRSSSFVEDVAKRLSYNGLQMYFIPAQQGIPIGARKILPGIDIINQPSTLFTYSSEEDREVSGDNLEEITKNHANWLCDAPDRAHSQKCVGSYSYGSNNVELNSKLQSLVLSNDEKKP